MTAGVDAEAGVCGDLGSTLFSHGLIVVLSTSCSRRSIESALSRQKQNVWVEVDDFAPDPVAPNAQTDSRAMSLPYSLGSLRGSNPILIAMGTRLVCTILRWT
jgi:hypothetical protein